MIASPAAQYRYQRSSKAIAVSVGMLLLASCVTIGRPFDKSTVEKFEKGKTTYDQVVAVLGKPTKSMDLPLGERYVTYQFNEAHVTENMLIPFTTGGVAAHGALLHIQFDEAGRVEKWDLAESSGHNGQPTHELGWRKYEFIEDKVETSSSK